MRVAWPAATDPSSTIARYELQTQINGGDWAYTVATSAAVRELKRSVTISGSGTYRFRVRAQDSAGHWSAWATAAQLNRIRLVDDRSSSIVYSGSWTRRAYTYAANKTLTASSLPGSRATMTSRATGSPSWRHRYRGSVDMYLDGKFVKTSSRSSTSVTRQVITGLELGRDPHDRPSSAERERLSPRGVRRLPRRQLGFRVDNLGVRG
jgi:hypothetical protein